jgi:peptidoglycan/xylan/chitin deacetylase (PgdA/CDA1 family)
MSTAHATHGAWEFDGPHVSLTFDDGPTPGVTDRILDVLERESVRAIFFVCGEYAHSHPELVRRAATDGHAIGNHTWHHPPLHQVGKDVVRRELSDTQNLIADLTGARCRLFRPPGGMMTPQVIRTAHELELFTVLWTLCPRDWSCPGPEVIVQRVVAGVRAGSIVLLHDGCGNLLQRPVPESICADRTNTIDALPDVIRQIRVFGLTLHGVSAQST